MDEETRLSQLVEGLTSDPRYVDGQTRYPGAISDDDAAEIAEALMAETDEGVEARGRSAASQNVTIACHQGCAGCCEELIMVWEPEAIAVSRWLERPENEAARKRFLAGYPAWRARVGDAPARLGERSAAGDQAGHMKIFLEQWRKRVPCAFNHEGDCTIYPIRPINCRNAHAVDTSTYCTGGASDVPATRLAYPPLQSFLDRAQELLRAAHHALGKPRKRPAALCSAVYQRLTGSERGGKVSRNAPCPCGSGKKYKRCCGA